MKNFIKNNAFIMLMLVGIVAGCIVGAVWPKATVLEPLGTLFINLMFCIVVPMVFCSISSAIAAALIALFAADRLLLKSFKPKFIILTSFQPITQG